MPAAITPASHADMRDFLRCNQLLAQHLDGSPPCFVGGLRWFLQCFYYCCPVEPDYRVTLHQHDWLEVALLCKGRVEYRTPEHSVILNPGDIFFMPPGRTHSWKTVKAPVSIAGFQLKISALDKSGEAVIKALNDRVDAGGFSLRKTAALSRIHQAIWEMIHQEAPSPLLAEKLRGLNQLFLQELIERVVPAAVLAAPTTAAPIIGPDTLATSKYQQIVEFVHHNINQPIQLEDIASHFHYSVRHVARLFRSESGVALGQYILEQKLCAAKRLLATTDYPVKTIALDLGYTDVGYFCRLFRTHLMGTPNKYRTQLLSGRTNAANSPTGHHSFRGGTFRTRAATPAATVPLAPNAAA